jgi:hypothetical protein
MQRSQGGFSYVIALFLVAALAIFSVRAMENTASKEQRDREAELLTIGQAYYVAIRQYYENSPGVVKAYPKELVNLLEDARATKITRPLRRLYRDPITGSADWGVIRAADGGVMGIYSRSNRKPFKVAGFPIDMSSFSSANTYQDWKFSYQP